MSRHQAKVGATGRLPLPGIILAAGASIRFAPRHKLLQAFRGKPLVWHVVSVSLEAGLSPVLLVVGYHSKQIVKALGTLGNHPQLQVVYNPEWESGRASSLKAGIRRLPATAEGFLAAPADLPLLSTDLLGSLIDAFAHTGRLCFPVYDGKKGHPVIFPRFWFARLLDLHGEQSAHALIRSHWASATKLERTDVETQINVNTPKDYRQLSGVKA